MVPKIFIVSYNDRCIMMSLVKHVCNTEKKCNPSMPFYALLHFSSGVFQVCFTVHNVALLIGSPHYEMHVHIVGGEL